MTRDEIDIMWNKALQQAIKDGEEFTRYHFAELVAAAERKSKSHSLAPGQMELSLQREHNGELFEYRYRFTHLQVMNKAEFFVKEIARKLDVEMDRAIQARGNT